MMTPGALWELLARLEDLVFDERVAEARALFDEHAAELEAIPEAKPQVLALGGYFAFHDERFDLAEARLELVTTMRATKFRPIRGRASFYLAALAHRHGDDSRVRHWLANAIREGGQTFIADWAEAQWLERFPGAPLPARRVMRRGVSWSLAKFAGYATLLLFMLLLFVPLGVAAQRKTKETAFATRIATGQPGVTEAYFLGGAGWAHQDVFLREVRAANETFARRYDTAGRSIVLANDPAAGEGTPLLTNATLRASLKAIGSRMNRDEDVLFLYLTSHGSHRGLALSYDDDITRDRAIAPADLRAYLDESGIKWRVLVIQGCETGVFVDALSSDTTIVATASSDDRPSYGCATGNQFTDFGRALIEQELPASDSIIDALERADHDVAVAEANDARLPSRPQLAIGTAIRGKLVQMSPRQSAP